MQKGTSRNNCLVPLHPSTLTTEGKPFERIMVKDCGEYEFKKRCEKCRSGIGAIESCCHSHLMLIKCTF